MNQFQNHTKYGIATLELVLSLPVMLALMVALVWLGFSVIYQAQVNTLARHDAWGQRFEPWSGTSFNFNESDSQAEGRASKQVRVTPLFAQVAGPEAKSLVEKGPWDHRSVRFDAFPNLDLVADMVLVAKTTQLTEQIDDLQQALDGLQRLGAAALQEALRDITSELTNPTERLKSGSEAGERRVELDRELDENKAESRLRELRGEQAAIEAELDEAEEESELSWLLEQQLERIEIEIEIAEQRLDDLRR